MWKAGGTGYVPEFDRDVIERYVDYLLRRAAVLAELDKVDPDDEDGFGGMIVKGSQGQPVANPLLRVLERIDRQLGILEKTLGRSPEARVRLGLGIAHVMDELDQFLAAGDE